MQVTEGMIGHVADLFSAWIWLAFLASWRALPVFAAAGCLVLLLRRRVPARAVCGLWLLVVARLLLPLSIESDFAIAPWLDESVNALTSTGVTAESVESGYDTFTYEQENGETITIALLPPGATAEEQAAADAEVQRLAMEEASITQASIETPPGTLETLLLLCEPFLIAMSCALFVGFPVIGIILLLRGLVSHFCFAWQIRTLPPISDRDAIDCMLRVCDDLGVGRRPVIKELPAIQAPAVFGLLRSTVCLPIGWQDRLNTEQLDWVFRHEVAHVKGRDGIWMFLANVARALNWFNPLAWVTLARLQHHMERAADQAATGHLDEGKIRDYGELLLSFAAERESSHPCTAVGLLAMAAPKGLAQRISDLARDRPRNSWGHRLALLSLVVMIAAVGLTDAKTLEATTVLPEPIPELNVALANAELPRFNPVAEPRENGEAKVVAFDVTNALRKALELKPKVDAEAFLMNYFATHPSSKETSFATEISDGVMRVQCTEQRATLIKQMLAAFERSGLWQISTEIRILRTDVRNLNQLDWSGQGNTVQCQRLLRELPKLDSREWDTTFASSSTKSSQFTSSFSNLNPATSAPVRAIRISRLESEILIHQMQRDLRSNILHAPRVTLFNGQCASVSDISQRPFVTDVTVVAGDLNSALQPRISVVDEGWRLLLKTTVTEDEEVKLQIVLHHSSIEGIKLAALPYAGGARAGEQVTVQVPTVQSESIAVQSELSDSDALLVYSPVPYIRDDPSREEPGLGQVFMIRTKLIPDNSMLDAFVPAGSKIGRGKTK
ncbi:MAG: M56 family metallopeptidase [Planctomycetota bacterium]